MKKTVLAVAMMFGAIVASNAQIVKTDILSDYAAGDALEKSVYLSKEDPAKAGVWCGAFSSKPVEGAASPVIGEPLIYEGYPEKGPSIVLGSGFKGDIKGRRVSVYTLTGGKELKGGALYLSFLVDFNSIGVKKMSQFVGFCTSAAGGGNRGTVYVKRDESSRKDFYWGVRLSEDIVECPQSFQMDKTYLVVVKLDYATQTASLFVDPDLGAAEPQPLVCAKAVEKPFKHNIRGFNLRDGHMYKGNLGNFRVARSWEALSE